MEEKVMKKFSIKKTLILMLSLSLLPFYTSCRLSNTPKEAVPVDPDPEITLSSSSEAPLISSTTTTTTTTTAATTAKRFFGKVTADILNVRKSASADSDILGQLNLNDEVEVLGKKDNFYKIKTATLEGFCAKDYILLTSDNSNTNAADSENSVAASEESTNSSENSNSAE